MLALARLASRSQGDRATPLFLHLITKGFPMRLLLTAIACCLGAAVNVSAAEIKSISRLAVGPGNVLFVADWKAGRVHAITLPGAPQRPTGTAFNILDLETLLSKQVGGAKFTVEDMVARPGTAEVYVAISYGASKTPALIAVTNDHKARRVELQVLERNARAKLYGHQHEVARWRDLHRGPFQSGLCVDSATGQLPVRRAAIDDLRRDLPHGPQSHRDACPDSCDELRDLGRKALSRRGLHVHASSHHPARGSQGWRSHPRQDDRRARLREHARGHDLLLEDRGGQDGGLSPARQLRTGSQCHPGVRSG